MRVRAVDCHLGLHPVPIHSHLLLPPPSSVTLSTLPLFFSPAFSRKWSQSSSRITWNNLEWGVPFSLSLPPPPPPFCPLLTGPGQLICFRSQLCVQSTVCSQQGMLSPAFVSTIPLWTVCVFVWFAAGCTWSSFWSTVFSEVKYRFL